MDRGLTIPLLASKLDVDKNTLGAYEREERLPDIEFLGKFARLTGYDAAKLLRNRTLASEEAPAFQEALSEIRSATSNVASFLARRSGVTRSEVALLQEEAHEHGLTVEGLEERFGAKYPLPSEALRAEQPRAQYGAGHLHGVTELVSRIQREEGFELSSQVTLLLVDLLFGEQITEQAARRLVQYFKGAHAR